MIDLPPDLLRGSYPPLVTPFRDGEIDLESFAGLVEHQVDAGSHGIVVCGTTAEPSTLTVPERKALLDVAIRASAGRIPIVAATGSQSLAETLDLCEHAERTGASALLVVTPYYIRPPERGLVEYFVKVGEATTLPLCLYHIPGRTGVEVSLDALAAIADRAPRLVGMKHASNDLELVSAALERFGPEFRIHVGLEALSFPMLCLGAAGMMNAVGNVSPERVAALYEAVAAGDLGLGRKLHFELRELNASVFFDTNPIPIKYMLRRLGRIPANEHRLPMRPARPELEERLDGVLQRAGLL